MVKMVGDLLMDEILHMIKWEPPGEDMYFT